MCVNDLHCNLAYGVQRMFQLYHKLSALCHKPKGGGTPKSGVCERCVKEQTVP